jgi:hypothetical protein
MAPPASKKRVGCEIFLLVLFQFVQLILDLHIRQLTRNEMKWEGRGEGAGKREGYQEAYTGGRLQRKWIQACQPRKVIR